MDENIKKAIVRLKIAVRAAQSQLGREHLVLDAFKACERDFKIPSKELYGKVEKLDPQLFIDIQHVLHGTYPKT